MNTSADRWFIRPALVFLAATLLVGVWMRAALLHAPLTGGLPFRFIVHAHSHLAFFGWVNMALFGVLVATVQPVRRATSLLRVHAAILTFASVAAFVAFLTGGYNAPAIALSVVHVMLWVWFVALMWRATEAQPFWRAALAYLLVAGSATFAPLVVLLRGAGSAWAAELAIKLFLIPFINGWVTLGVMGAFAGAAGYRGGRGARFLIAAGALPSTLLFIAAPPPAAAFTLVGRAGAALVALGSIGFVLGMLRTRVQGWWTLVGLSALALKGTIELLAAAGVGGALMRSPPVVLAHLHLVLLGFVSAALLGVLTRGRRDAWALVFAAGAGLMLAALVINGWSQLFLLVQRAGVDIVDLLRIALLGGVLAAIAATAAALRVLIARAETSAMQSPGETAVTQH